jgi:hypothetical protein
VFFAPADQHTARINRIERARNSAH